MHVESIDQDKTCNIEDLVSSQRAMQGNYSGANAPTVLLGIA